MLRFPGKYALKVFFVKSQSKEDKTYRVELWGDGKITCECPAGTFRRRKQYCYHAREKRNELEAIYGSIEGAVSHYRELKKQKNG